MLIASHTGTFTLFLLKKADEQMCYISHRCIKTQAAKTAVLNT
jgi:hypothetical protein